MDEPRPKTLAEAIAAAYAVRFQAEDEARAHAVEEQRRVELIVSGIIVLAAGLAISVVLVMAFTF